MQVNKVFLRIKIIYQDEDILVIDKPAHLISAKTEASSKETLADIFKDYYLIHRLDKDTSGLILIAKNQEILDKVQSQFKAREVKKQYLALVHGKILEAGSVSGNIGRNPVKREKFTIIEDGREAETEYEPIKLLVMSSELVAKIFKDLPKKELNKLRTMNYPLYTLVACRPKTGRTHQIRVHLKYINHPIVADEKYAGRKILKLDQKWCPRQFLHAAKIGFKHPVTGNWMEFESELPKDLKEALDSLI